MYSNMTKKRREEKGKVDQFRGSYARWGEKHPSILYLGSPCLCSKLRLERSSDKACLGPWSCCDTHYLPEIVEVAAGTEVAVIEEWREATHYKPHQLLAGVTVPPT